MERSSIAPPYASRMKRGILSGSVSPSPLWIFLKTRLKNVTRTGGAGPSRSCHETMKRMRYCISSSATSLFSSAEPRFSIGT